jgi:hypothetical protein
MPAAGGTATVTLSFFGNGSGSSDANPDFDLVVCTTLSGTGSCSYAQDIIPGNAASVVNQPETGTTGAIAGGAQVWVRTFSYYATTNAGEHAYQLKIKTQ